MSESIQITVLYRHFAPNFTLNLYILNGYNQIHLQHDEWRIWKRNFAWDHDLFLQLQKILQEARMAMEKIFVFLTLSKRRLWLLTHKKMTGKNVPTCLDYINTDLSSFATQKHVSLSFFKLFFVGLSKIRHSANSPKDHWEEVAI